MRSRLKTHFDSLFLLLFVECPTPLKMKGKKVQFLVGCGFIRRNEPGGIQSISLYLLSPWVGVRFLEQVTEVNMIENKTKQRKTLYETKFQ